MMRNYPPCPKCGRDHKGECLMGKDVCYRCGKPGHHSKDLSRPSPPGRDGTYPNPPVGKPNPIAWSHRQRTPKRKITKRINKSRNNKKKEITTILLQDPPQDLASVGNQASKQKGVQSFYKIQSIMHSLRMQVKTGPSQ